VSVVAENDLRHVGQIFVQQEGELLRVELLRDGREPRMSVNITVISVFRGFTRSDFPASAGSLPAEVLLERAAHSALLFFLDQAR